MEKKFVRLGKESGTTDDAAFVTVYTVKSACNILKEDVEADERDLFQGFWRIKA